MVKLYCNFFMYLSIIICVCWYGFVSKYYRKEKSVSMAQCNLRRSSRAPVTVQRDCQDETSCSKGPLHQPTVKYKSQLSCSSSIVPELSGLGSASSGTLEATQARRMNDQWRWPSLSKRGGANDATCILIVTLRH